MENRDNDMPYPINGAFFLRDSVKVTGGLADVEAVTDIPGKHPVIILSMPMDVGISTVQIILGSPLAFATFMTGVVEMLTAAAFRDDVSQVVFDAVLGEIRPETSQGKSEAPDSDDVASQ